MHYLNHFLLIIFNEKSFLVHLFSTVPNLGLGGCLSTLLDSGRVTTATATAAGGGGGG
jgi:hypothetical protein